MTQTSAQLHLTACPPLWLTTPAPAPAQHQRHSFQPKHLRARFQATSQASPFPWRPGLSRLTLPQREAKGRGLGEFSRELLRTIFTFPVPLLPAPPSELVPAGSVCVCVCVCVRTHTHTRTRMISHVQLLAKPRNVARQALLSMGFPKEEYWSGLPFPSPGNLPNPGIQHKSLVSPALAGGSFTTRAPPGSPCR